MVKVYNISMKTPIGTQSGKLTFVINENSLSGTIIGNNIRSSFNNVKISNNNFEFSGTINKGFLYISYYAKGTLNKDIITGTVKTKYGTFLLEGNIIK